MEKTFVVSQDNQFTIIIMTVLKLLPIYLIVKDKCQEVLITKKMSLLDVQTLIKKINQISFPMKAPLD